MASTYLSRTPSSTGNRKTFTWSAWVKRANLTRGFLFIAWDGSTYTDSSMLTFSFNANNALQVETGATNLRITNQLFRDTSAWYHIVFSCDTTQATASDRLKLYVNGSEITSFSTNNNVSQNNDMGWNHTFLTRIGSSSGAHYFDGEMTHIHNIDGTAYDATAFGQYDANGVWTINTSPSVTYGTNGFFILKDGNSVTDQSGNGNNFTVGGGTLTNTEDNPSNVFATFNPLNQISSVSYTNGNNTFTNSASDNRLAFPTLAMTSGKFYCEMKVVTLGANFTHIGLRNIGSYTLTNAYVNEPANEKVSYVNDGRVFIHGGTTSSGNPTFTSGDIIGMACDMDNGYLYYHKNGTYINSGSPTSGASGTGGFDIYNHASVDYCFAVSTSDGGTDPVISANFGNGYFGTTAVSSAGTNASGNGIFEYDVPTGYTALSTKGLNL